MTGDLQHNDRSAQYTEDEIRGLMQAKFDGHEYAFGSGGDESQYDIRLRIEDLLRANVHLEKPTDVIDHPDYDSFTDPDAWRAAYHQYQAQAQQFWFRWFAGYWTVCCATPSKGYGVETDLPHDVPRQYRSCFHFLQPNAQWMDSAEAAVGAIFGKSTW